MVIDWRIVLVSLIFSLVITLATIRGCLADFLPQIICGPNLISKSPFQKLKSNQVAVVSNISESKEHSLDKGRGAAALIDGKLETDAAPGSRVLDYTIDLFDYLNIKTIKIIWSDYGINKNYIKNWSIEALKNDGRWQLMAGGSKSPGGETVINKKITASQLRLKAQSDEDWIGIYEVEIVARPLQ